MDTADLFARMFVTARRKPPSMPGTMAQGGYPKPHSFAIGPMPEAQYLLAACLFVGAVLYTSVGHAGASAYIAAMALFSVPVAVMRPTALALNILAASFGSFRYLWAGFFRWRAVWPFLLGSVPFAFIGGGFHLPGEFYRPLVGAILLFAGDDDDRFGVIGFPSEGQV